jgi:hypothetical protein
VTKRAGLDAVDGDAIAVDLDHRDPPSIAVLELGNTGDVDLGDTEAELRREGSELLPRALAQVAIAGDEERDRLQGYSPRIVLASATRETARPYAARRTGRPRDSWRSQVSR